MVFHDLTPLVLLQYFREDPPLKMSLSVFTVDKLHLRRLLVILFVGALIYSKHVAATNDDTTTTEGSHSYEPWQTCQTFMAPSQEQQQGMGWGVFAGRSFQQGEIVEMAPGIIPLDQDAPAIFTSALDDYVYGYYRLQYPAQLLSKAVIHPMYAVMLGMGMIYNHHVVSPNLEYTTFGREPAPDVPKAANSIGFKALRDIQAGEELFSTYGMEDGGKDWFSRRKILIRSPDLKERRIRSEDLATIKAEYCSKIAAGIGLPTWQERILPILPPPPHVPFWIDSSKWLPPWDAEIGSAVAKVPIAKGERIEVGTALIMSHRRHLQGTSLAAISFLWKDLSMDHQLACKELRRRGYFKLQYNEFDSESSWNRTDGFAFWDDVSLLPIGGNIGLVARNYNMKETNFGSSSSNCEFAVLTNDTFYEPQSVIVVLELIATKDIAVGDQLRLDILSSATAKEQAMLRNELQLMGRLQPKDPSSWRSKKMFETKEL